MCRRLDAVCVGGGGVGWGWGVCVWVCVTTIQLLASIHFSSSAALLPVSPASSEPISGTASSPSPMETAPVNTRGRYQWDMCTSWVAVYVCDWGAYSLHTLASCRQHSGAVYCMLGWWESERCPTRTADSSGSERCDPPYKGACSL